MNWKTINIIRMLLDPKVTRTPFKVLRELNRRGIKRMPGKFYSGKGKAPGRPAALRFIKQWLRGENPTRHNGQWVLNSFLPPFPGKAYDKMFENLLSGRRLSPVSAFLAVTAECPYNCLHCSLKKRKSGNLDTAQWLNAIFQLQQLGTSIIGFTGGEPLLREDLPQLVEAAVKGGSEVIIFSSGAGFTREKAEQLKQAGAWAFCVSLDNTDAEAMSTQRGRADALETALNALKLSHETGFYTMTGTLAMPESIRSGRYLEIYRMAEELNVDEFRMVEPMPCGRMQHIDENQILTEELIAELRSFHVESNRRGRKPKVCCFNHIESPEFFGCGGGTQHLFIDPAGEVCPCDFTPMSFGNITQETFQVIWSRMTDAMGNPRRHCFIQKNYKLINRHAQESGSYPTSPEISCKICSEAGREQMPDYFQMVTGRKE